MALALLLLAHAAHDEGAVLQRLGAGGEAGLGALEVRSGGGEVRVGEG